MGGRISDKRKGEATNNGGMSSELKSDVALAEIDMDSQCDQGRVLVMIVVEMEVVQKSYGP